MDFAVFFQLFLPGLTTGCVYALVALGFVLTANVSGVVNFAQGEFVMLGGIVAAALVANGMPMLPAIAIATLVGAVVAAARLADHEAARVRARYGVAGDAVHLHCAGG